MHHYWDNAEPGITRHVQHNLKRKQIQAKRGSTWNQHKSELRTDLMNDWRNAWLSIKSSTSNQSGTQWTQNHSRPLKQKRHQECLQANGFCRGIRTHYPGTCGQITSSSRSAWKGKKLPSQAHQLDNKDPEIIKDIGNIFSTPKNDTEAIDSIKQLFYWIRTMPYNNLGLIAKRQMNLVDAEQLVKRAWTRSNVYHLSHESRRNLQDLGNLVRHLPQRSNP